MPKKRITTVVLAGGQGSRLWPISRTDSPKQFVKFHEFCDKSLFQLAFERAMKVSSKKDIYVLVTPENQFHAINQAKEIYNGFSEENIIHQHGQKETLPPIMGAMQVLQDRGVQDVLFLPSDQVLHNENDFAKEVHIAWKLLDTRPIIVFGVSPRSPHTGYGYIDFDVQTDKNNSFKIKRFKQKPKEALAKKYVKNGFVWNTFMFLTRTDFFWEQVEKYAPKEYKLFVKNDFKTFCDKVSPIMADDILFEKSDSVYVKVLGNYWNDLGSFEELARYFENYCNKRIIDVVATGSKNNVVISEQEIPKKTALVGVEDLIIVDAPDALLISKKNSDKDLKKLVKTIKKEEHKDQSYGIIEYRKWGSHTLIDSGDNFRTKRITLLPKAQMQSQIHKKRSEHWVVVEGNIEIQVGKKKQKLRSGESFFVPKNTVHSMTNLDTKKSAHIIEVQVGKNIDETDMKYV